MSTREQERKKYEEVWNFESYRQACHGLTLWKEHREIFPEHVRTAMDFGCGTGRLVHQWRQEGIEGFGIDIASNAPDVEAEPYVYLGCLWDDVSHLPDAELGVCTDVMEHIPEEYVDEVVKNIQSKCRVAVYKIANFESMYEGRNLHLTLHDAYWWIKKLAPYGFLDQFPGRPGIQEFTLRVTS